MQEEKLNAFIGKFVQDLGAVMHSATVLVGDKLGLYKAMGGAGPLTPAQLAERTGTDERYVREWLSAQAASGYVDYDAKSGAFTLPEEHAFVLTSEDNPVFLPGAFQVAASTLKDEPMITDAFRNKGGVGWHEHHEDLFEGTRRFFRPNYIGNLVSAWIPAMEGVDARLRAGAKVADVGCGHGASTILMAQEYPKSRFFGFDYHEESIDAARAQARQAGVAARVTFDVASAKGFPGDGFDLVAYFDCLHDMGDPVGAARHVHEALAPSGSWLIVEPFAYDRLEQNLNPVGRVFYSVSTMVCTPASRAQEVGMALGAQAGEARIRDVVTRGGFKQFRRVAETPFNLVFQARR
jgi:SAM-dependent methyltransferase